MCRYISYVRTIFAQNEFRFEATVLISAKKLKEALEKLQAACERAKMVRARLRESL